MWRALLTETPPQIHGSMRCSSNQPDIDGVKYQDITEFGASHEYVGRSKLKVWIFYRMVTAPAYGRHSHAPAGGGKPR